MDVFVDASAFVALNNLGDAHAKASWRIFEKLQKESTHLTTTNFVIAEALTVISLRAGRANAIDFGRTVMADVEVIRITEMEEALAFERFADISQKDVSFVDCLSFVACEQRGITDVFTFDKDFAKQGFKLIRS